MALALEPLPGPGELAQLAFQRFLVHRSAPLDPGDQTALLVLVDLGHPRIDTTHLIVGLSKATTPELVDVALQCNK